MQLIDNILQMKDNKRILSRVMISGVFIFFSSESVITSVGGTFSTFSSSPAVMLTF